MATDKQVSYVLSLMSQAGYGTQWMGSEHKRLGASMRERSGTVEGWLRGKPTAEVSRLIDTLKAEAERGR